MSLDEEVQKRLITAYDRAVAERDMLEKSNQRLTRQVGVLQQRVDNLLRHFEGTLQLPISTLNLSVRTRKCMVRLGISTVGELIARDANDLLECINFGITSLNEIREKLTERGLSLRGEKPHE